MQTYITKVPGRNYQIDNIRFILIFLVVFGHLLELIGGDIGNYLYKMIYLFHMPAFMFITGYFAYFSQKKIIFHLMFPYIIFQILYLAFQALVIEGETTVVFQFTTPYWLLWYLLMTIFCYLLIPFIQSDNIKYQISMLTGSIILSLCANYDSTIGYYMSLSRFFTFLPYFISGYYISHYHLFENPKRRKGVLRLYQLLSLTGVTLSLIYIRKVDFPVGILYGSGSYEALSYTPFMKLILLIFGFSWIALLMITVSPPPKKLFAISTFGKNTFPIFLMHGFIIKLVGKYGLFKYSLKQNLILAAMLSFMIVTAFGNIWTNRLFNNIFTEKWIDEIIDTHKPKET